MEQMQFVLGILLFIIINIVYYKSKKLNKLRKYVYKVFWVDEIADPKNKHKFAYKTLNVYVKFFMHFYITVITLVISNSIVYLNIEMILGTIFAVIVFPLMYRVIMGIQRKIHGI